MYKNLSELPIQINGTGQKQFSPQNEVIRLLEKSQNRDRNIEHFDQSLSLIDNIKRSITILSDNRITFIS